MSLERKSLLGRRLRRGSGTISEVEGGGSRPSLEPGLQGAVERGDGPSSLPDSPVLADGPGLQGQSQESSQGGDQMNETIPKESLLCDLCNRTLVDEKGDVLEDFVWTDWSLICREKFEEFDKSDFEVIAQFEQGDRISKDHEFFAPMKITWF
ncbi:hypothetical protein AKJ36_01240 [candidate division MSBL1 archaeon SCGC-AAA259I07]|uniref:Uncharacterized protein n=1 Tax=candidate division MSBL1 archaeon SCGC-AAA259I07 TaxID=1698266 RepID=A0A133ULW3_9EURY|nr:hypothetical protein AKJ36_01240 [candidate division MSBL1 archaeon SCGC-AAA259I07]